MKYDRTRRYFLAVTTALAMSFAISDGCEAAVARNPTMAASKVPNIVFILVDDMGYGDLSSFGQRRLKTQLLIV